MTVDIEKLEALAKGCRDEVIRSHGWAGMIADADLLRRDSEFLKECSPDAVLDLISSGKRMAARLMCCPACQGEGEVYSGRTTYEGYNQPPEPIMGRCGECDGDGVLGDADECISILDELETLRASVHGLKTGYEAYERVNAELRAECEKLRKDAERLNWLGSKPGELISSPTWSDPLGDVIGYSFGVDGDYRDIRQTVDAAMSKGEQS